MGQYDFNNAFYREIEALIDREIAENQIRAAEVEFLDERRQKAVLRIWRRAPRKDSHGDDIEELRSLVSKGDGGALLCQVIQGSRLEEA